MLKLVSLCLFSLFVSSQSQATPQDDFDGDLIKDGNTKISECTMKTGHGITLSVYANVSTPFKTWEDSPGIMHFVFKTTEPTYNGKSSMLLDLTFDFNDGGTAGFHGPEVDNVQLDNSLPFTWVDISQPTESKWLMSLDLWHDEGAALWAQFTCVPTWTP